MDGVAAARASRRWGPGPAFLMLNAVLAAWAAPAAAAPARAVPDVHAIGTAYPGDFPEPIALGGLALRPDRSVLVVGGALPEVDLGGGPAKGTDELRAFIAAYALDGKLLFALRSSTGTSAAHAVRVDGAGNAYVAGWSRDAFELGGQTLASRGQRDGWVAKLDPEGRVVWLRAFGGRMDDNLDDIALDAQGGVVLTGTFFETAVFGDSPEITSGFHNLALIKLDPGGALTWQRSFNLSGSQSVPTSPRLATDAQGRILLVSQFRDPISLGGRTLATNRRKPGPCGKFPGAVSMDCAETVGANFAALFSPDGSHLWSALIAGTQELTSYTFIESARSAGANRWKLSAIQGSAARPSLATRRTLVLGGRGGVLSRSGSARLDRRAPLAIAAGTTRLRLAPHVASELDRGRVVFGWDIERKQLQLVVPRRGR